MERLTSGERLPLPASAGIEPADAVSTLPTTSVGDCTQIAYGLRIPDT